MPKNYDFFGLEITQCKQCKRVHTRKGDVCQECENYNALHKVKTMDDQSKGELKTLFKKGI